KQKGEGVQRDENLVDLETDKVVLEVPAVADGVLVDIKVEAGATVTAGDVLGYLEEGASAADGAADADAGTDAAPSGNETSAGAETESATGGEAMPASPAAQKLMAENDIAASAVKGSGKDGRITKADVQTAIDERGSAPPAAATASAGTASV